MTDLAEKNSLNLSLLNVHSVRNKCCHLWDFVKDNFVAFFLCMSETWLYDNDSAFISASTPESRVLHPVPRPDEKGGGVACKKFQVFRVYGCSIIKWEKKSFVTLFLQETESLILESEINEADVIYLGDLNIWVDDVRNNDAQNFLRLLNTFRLVNLVNEPMHNSGHTLDLVITKNHHSLMKSSTVDTITTLSDHRKVNFQLNFNYAKIERKLIRFRK